MGEPQSHPVQAVVEQDILPDAGCTFEVTRAPCREGRGVGAFAIGRGDAAQKLVQIGGGVRGTGRVAGAAVELGEIALAQRAIGMSGSRWSKPLRIAPVSARKPVWADTRPAKASALSVAAAVKVGPL